MDLETLKLGIKWWENKKPKWREDFLPGFYEKLYRERPPDLDEKWWEWALAKLGKWSAIRPNTKKEIRERGLERLKLINEHYHAILQGSVSEPSLAGMKWESIATLFDVLRQIKGSQSPVFPSKLGHFLFPRLFIVMDNEATGVRSYEVTWRRLKTAWQEFRDKDQAKEILSAAIRKYSPSIHAEYPFETKIAELWLIGYKHG